MDNMCEQSDQHQNDLTMINSLHNQSLQGDPVLKCEHPQPDPYLQIQQNLTPDLTSERPAHASTLNPLTQHDQQYQGNINCLFKRIQWFVNLTLINFDRVNANVTINC